MATFAQFKEEITEHKASNQWVTSTTSTNDIYWKLLYSSSGFGKRIANYPDTDEIKSNLQKLSMIVSALCKSFGSKIHINSGYRNVSTNNAVGGVNGSQHSKGQAVDLDCNNMSKVDKAKLFIFLLNSKDWKNKIDQIIWENNGAWVHCSFKCNSTNISSDSSYSPRPYGDATKVYWMNTSGAYINIWNGAYKREKGGYVYFEGVPGLSGVTYDGKSFQVDYSKIGVAEGSDLSGNASEFISGGSGVPLVQNYGGSISRGANKVTNLFKARNRAEGTDPNIDENRKSDFEALVTKMISETPELGRDIIQSQEMYDPSILKGDQVSKKSI